MAREDGGPKPPALQVIVLGSGGGPTENNMTAMLVRSLKEGWGRGSVVAVDAGVHLAAITRILTQTQPKGLGTTVPLPHVLRTGPFAGMELNFASASANAAHVIRQLIDTYMITHPHLDHISGFVINSAGLAGARPKRLAGLPSTISAFKSHIFNNVIWANMSDENNGAGLVTYMRLVEGGSPALGEGDGKGYVEISDGLTVRVFGVSHGHCIERHVHRGSSASSRHGSLDTSSNISHRGVPGGGSTSGPSPSVARASSASLGAGSGSQGSSSTGQERDPTVCVYESSAYFVREPVSKREVLIFGDVEPDSISLSPRNRLVWQEAAPRIAAGNLAAIFIECSFDDSQPIDRLFGHLTPRFIIEELTVLAAEVRAARHRNGEFSSQSSDSSSAKPGDSPKKRKRVVAEGAEDAEEGRGRRRGKRTNGRTAAKKGEESPVSPKSRRPGPAGPREPGVEARVSPPPLPSWFPVTQADDVVVPVGARSWERHYLQQRLQQQQQQQQGPRPDLGTPADPSLARTAGPTAASATGPLRGLKIVIIHVKDRLDDELPQAGEKILGELLRHEASAGLGCEFIVSTPGQSFML